MKKTRYREKIMERLSKMTPEQMRAYAHSLNIKYLLRNPNRIRNYIADTLVKRKYPDDVIVDCDVKSKKHADGTVITITMNIELYGKTVGNVKVASDKIAKMISEITVQ